MAAYCLQKNGPARSLSGYLSFQAMPQLLAFSLVGSFKTFSSGLQLVHAFEIERHCSANELLQGRLIHLVAFVNSMARLTFPSRLELKSPAGLFQRSSLGESQLDHVLIGFSGANDAAVGKDGVPTTSTLLDHRIRRGLSRAPWRASSRATVPQFVDPRIDKRRGIFRRHMTFHGHPLIGLPLDALRMAEWARASSARTPSYRKQPATRSGVRLCGLQPASEKVRERPQHAGD